MSRLVTKSPRLAPGLRAERGQTTAEYVLLILGAAAIAVLVIAWAGGTDKIASLLDRVFDSILTTVNE